MKILIIDDEKYSLDKVIFLFSRFGEFDIHIATTWKECLSIIESGIVFDVITSNLTMPDIAGLDLIYRLKMSYPSTPIVVISGIANAYALELINLGVDDRILKPALLPLFQSIMKKYFPNDFDKILE